MNEMKGLVWIFGMILIAVLLCVGDPDILDAIKWRIADMPCSAEK